MKEATKPAANAGTERATPESQAGGQSDAPALASLNSQPLTRFVFDPDAEPPAEQVIFDGFLSQSDLVAWIGREKHRKTNLLLQLAICAAVGRNFLHFRFRAPQPLRVVYVDYESKTQKLKERYEAIRRSLGLSDDQSLLLKENLTIIEVRRAYKEGLALLT